MERKSFSGDSLSKQYNVMHFSSLLSFYTSFHSLPYFGTFLTNELPGTKSLRRHQLCVYSRTWRHFMEPEGSLLCSQRSSTSPYHKPTQSSPYHPILSMIHFNIIHPLLVFLVVSFLHAFPPISYIQSSSPPDLLWSWLSYHPWLDHSWRRVQVMKLLVMQFSPTSCHFTYLQSKSSPQHPVLKYPQSIFLL
jgi:hypothetical protein